MAPVFRMRYDDEGQRNYIPVWKDGERLSCSSSGCHVVKDNVAPCCIMVRVVWWWWWSSLCCGRGVVLWPWHCVVAMALA